jgi:glycine/D-amino acid oxidase-like deaminating enzyme/nitrite reductase/ring-hydroxylating ferredoxin subunit
MTAIDQIELWCAELGIDCDFRRVPASIYSESDEGVKSLRKQFDHVRKLGLNADWLDAPVLPFARPGGICIANQGRFHAIRYINALARAFHGDGCVLFEHSRAHTPRDGKRCTVETDRGAVTARDVLLCTHAGFYGKSSVDLRIAPYNSYVLTARVEEEIPDGLFWDDEHPYHYIRRASSDDARQLLIGGADHKTGEGGDESRHPQTLRNYTTERFRVLSIEQEWSSEFFEPADGIPFVGRFPSAEHVYFAGGFSGTGLTFGTMAGKLLAEQCLNRPSDLSDLFALTRLRPFAAAKQMLTENVDAAWRFVADRLAPDPISSLNEIPIGMGRVVSYENKTLAVFRDGQGTPHLLSPQCTHAGCIVHWNEAESTWDCPCHGGRYTALGERLYGPPAHDLKREAVPVS